MSIKATIMNSATGRPIQTVTFGRLQKPWASLNLETGKMVTADRVHVGKPAPGKYIAPAEVWVTSKRCAAATRPGNGAHDALAEQDNTLDFDDQLRRYFGTPDLSAVMPDALPAGLDKMRVDFGLEQDTGRRFALWSLLYQLGTTRPRRRLQG